MKSPSPYPKMITYIYKADTRKVDSFLQSLKDDPDLFSVVPKKFIVPRFKKVLLRQIISTPFASGGLVERHIERLVVYSVLVTPEAFCAATIRAFKNG